MKTQLCFVIISLLLGLSGHAQISQNPKLSDTDKYYDNDFDFTSFNEWIASTQTRSVEESAQNLSMVLVSLNADYKRLSFCKTYSEAKSNFNMNVPASAQKALIYYSRKMMEEVDTFPLSFSFGGRSIETKKHEISSVFYYTTWELDDQDQSEESYSARTNYGDLRPMTILKKTTSLFNVSEEVRSRKLAAIRGLYRLLVIIKCSKITTDPSVNTDPEYQEDLRILLELIKRNIDLSRPDVGVPFRNWLKLGN